MEKPQIRLEINPDSISSFSLAQDLQVDRHLPLEFHPSSMLRGLFVILTAFQHFYSNNSLFVGNVIFYSDNLGVVCNSISGKFPNQKCTKIFKKISSYTLPEKLHLHFEWNRRNTFGLDICDKLSELFRLKFSSQGCIYIQKILQKKLCKHTKVFFSFFKCWNFPFTTFCRTQFI